MNARPAVAVIDDFLDDPDRVRELALRQQFHTSAGYKGRRTHEQFLDDSTREAFEKVLVRPITRWQEHEMNGTFQICTAVDPVVYHTDLQTHAGTIYLTPDAPVEAGLSLYRSRRDGNHRRAAGLSAGEIDDMFGGFYDKTIWEEVDRIGNLYNRLVLWDGSLVHAASCYFGQGLTDGRLFQMFFFDCAA